MFVHTKPMAFVVLSLLTALTLSAARADELAAAPLPQALASTPAPMATATPIDAVAPPAATPVESMLNDALDLIGIRYRRGGSSPETGFDCSGFVSHVFREGLGLYLPHSARAMSTAGSPVAREDLQPGDLVFFNTVRKTISHVGIYLGDNLFVHAPHRGAKIRIDELDARYWIKHFRGARRVSSD
jgi:cell wall-associated NlpC family hydrolase